jgi:hypothetical protein
MHSARMGRECSSAAPTSDHNLVMRTGAVPWYTLLAGGHPGAAHAQDGLAIIPHRAMAWPLQAGAPVSHPMMHRLPANLRCATAAQARVEYAGVVLYIVHCPCKLSSSCKSSLHRIKQQV